MIERIWAGKNPLYLLLLPLSLLYGAINHIRQYAYRRNWLKSWQAPVTVVVVGNLTVGGNGKTPLAIWLIEQLQIQGLRVGLVSRGYGGKAQHYPLLLDASTTPTQAGDEPVLIFQRTGVPVAVAPKRADAVKALIACHELDVVITDDGLQHYALKRDIEIVVVDGVRRFGNGWWLPAGPMRERAGRLKTVDAVVINGDNVNSTAINNNNMRYDEIAMTLQPTKIVNLLSGKSAELSELNETVIMAGIGHPPRFFATVAKLAVNVVAQHAFLDHQTYSAQQLNALLSKGQSLLMTEKDAVKCKRFAQETWWYLPINAELAPVGADRLINKIVTDVKLKQNS